MSAYEREDGLLDFPTARLTREYRLPYHRPAPEPDPDWWREANRLEYARRAAWRGFALQWAAAGALVLGLVCLLWFSV